MTCDVFTYATRKRVSGAFLSLDQAKAFDPVRHAYLFETLCEFGLPMDFVKVIRLLYSDLRCSMVVNGFTTDIFEYTQGIRQGCPLGSTLFVLFIEPFLSSIVCGPNIPGLPLTGVEELKVLALADISLFLRDARNLEYFQRAFASYTEVSGAMLNDEKS
ncbi:uncharacterized protein LOC142765839 [Rhipicephalus microplus]|uniref:uncharacterized protein LOC142765839 n=1 Tax=Rhipicephalus microplus TaxID=6941 RepID=UPI003F6B923E